MIDYFDLCRDYWMRHYSFEYGDLVMGVGGNGFRGIFIGVTLPREECGLILLFEGTRDAVVDLCDMGYVIEGVKDYEDFCRVLDEYMIIYRRVLLSYKESMGMI